MSLLERAKADIEKITSNVNEWARTMTFATPDGNFDITLDESFGTLAQVKGLHVKHHLAFDADRGKAVNGKTAHVTVSEKILTDAGYPVRDANGVVNLSNHKVKVKDSTGIEHIYVIREWFPDETIGLIVCILGDFEL